MFEASPEAVVMWTAAVVHAALACFVLIYHRHLPTQPWDRSFGFAICSMAVTGVGYAIVVGTDDLQLAARGQSLAYLGLLAGATSFIDYQQRLTGEPRAVLRHAKWWGGALCMVAAAAGLLVDSTRSAPSPAWHLLPAPRYTLAENAPAGLLLAAVAPWLIALSSIRLSRVGPASEEAGWIGGTLIVAQVVGVHDLLIWTGLLRSQFALPVVSLSVSMAMSLLILRRFTRDRAALLERRAALQRNYAELRRARDELVSTEQLAALGELSAVIAHEVRNPLTVIKHAASGLRRRGAPERQAHLIGVVAEESTRLRELVSDLLVYAKPLRLERSDFDLTASLEALADAELRLVGRQAALHWDLQLQSVALRADGHLLEQALKNVLRNAVQASPDGSTISVHTAKARLHGQPAVRVSVRDHGPGMDPLIRAKALDPFFTTRARGSGLGLAIVDRVVAAHGGQLALEPAAGGGLEVVLILPRDAPAVAAASVVDVTA